MTGNVNPNSRAAFVDRLGTLTKYGMETIKKINDALGLTDTSSVLNEIESNTVFDRSRGLSKRISELEHQENIQPNKYKSLERRVAALEESAGQVFKYKSILKRLDDIESQL